ncbi:HmuY family protein [Niabella hibiscisoli]|uniref:HmuY family protein n=1 Tax=Niabella hibiscisoli TaxID=1825928 RepID=UPI001F0F6A8D|nr:HmuY family protein [Niabella hibiscisoli]MCH5715154.1 HmuY family protein [Niabella hibiscisoli]
MKQLLVMTMAVAVLASCSKDEDPIIIVPPSNGSIITLNGLIASEAGTSAGNSVFVDFSTEKQFPVARESWDLGFYTGSDFRVITNNTTFAFAKVTGKTDINTVGSADTIGVVLSFNQVSPPLLTSGIADDPSGDLSKTAIPAISATEADNKVIIINRGTNGGIAAKDFIKIRILRSSNGYTLQYAPLTSSTFSTAQIAKSGDSDFAYISLSNGATVTTFPTKVNWDIQWGYSVMAFGTYYYGYSDVVAINHRNGVQGLQRIYSSAEVAADAFTKFNKDSVAKYSLSSDKWSIGSNWRTASQTVTSVAKDRFYIVKDQAGNYYKLKFVSFAAQDGGTRGKPQIAYELIK